jgi:hypothetical protein
MCVDLWAVLISFLKPLPMPTIISHRPSQSSWRTLLLEQFIYCCERCWLAGTGSRRTIRVLRGHKSAKFAVAVLLGIISPLHVSAADPSCDTAIKHALPRNQLVIPGYGSARAWTAGSFYRSPWGLKESVEPLAAAPKTDKTRTERNGKRKPERKKNSETVDTATTPTPPRQVAAPVTLLAWNPPCDTGIPSHKAVSQQQIGIDSDGSLDLTHGWVRYPDSSDRVVRAIQAFEKFWLLADITSANCQQSGPARIVSCSKDTNDRNFTLGQLGDAFVFRIRSGENDKNGTHREVTSGKVLAGQRQQVSVQYNGCTLTCAVDGATVSEQKMDIDFSSWELFPVMAGKETSADRAWSGHIHSLLMLPSVDYCTDKLDCWCNDADTES